MNNSFIEKMAVLYQAVPSVLLVSVRLAQACLESHYGNSELARHANNYAGIKASAPWTGEVYRKDTLEEVNGKMITAKGELFRKYKTIEEFVKDHSNFITSTEWRKRTYAKVIEATTYQGQCAALTQTYATDSAYGRKLIKLIEEYGLAKYDKEDITDMRTPIQMITNVNMGGSLNKVEYIAIHFVGAAGQARANGNYFKNVNRNASAHIFIDPNETVQVVPYNRIGWHVGDGRGKYGIRNDNTIGIELCQDVSTGSNVWEWDFHPETRKEGIKATAELMKKYNVPISRVVRHYDASRKSCPGNWMKNDWAKWWLFKKDLETYVKTGKLVDSQRNKSYNEVPAQTSQTKLTNREIAKQVYRGSWGNGRERKDRLTKAGYNYDEVQKEVQKYKEELAAGVKKPVEIPKSTGVYKFNSDVWVRTEAHLGKSSVTAEGYMYTKGDTVVIEKTFEREGILWGQYTSYSGKQRFVNLGVVDGKKFAEKL